MLHKVLSKFHEVAQVSKRHLRLHHGELWQVAGSSAPLSPAQRIMRTAQTAEALLCSKAGKRRSTSRWAFILFTMRRIAHDLQAQHWAIRQHEPCHSVQADYGSSDSWV